MEQLNRIELIGYVGTSHISEVENRKFARLTIATSLAYKSKDGTPVIETTWHNVTAWESACPEISKIEKGCPIHVIGRLRSQRYTGSDGIERTTTEIIANSIEILSVNRLAIKVL